MKRLWILGLSLIGVLLAFAVQAAPGTTPAGRTKQTVRPIATLAMDGPRVAYASGKKVYVWNTLTRVSSLMSGSYGAHTSEVAIAGTRVALITRYVVGNSLQTTERLYAGSVTSPARLLASGRRYAILNDGVPTTWYGRWIAGTVGSGKTLAVSTWWSARDGSCIGQRLSLVTPGGLKQIAVGPGTIMSQSSDAGRIAVLRSDEAWPIYGQSVAPTAAPTVGIYSATGALLRELTPSPAEEIALSGDRLVVLTQARTLEVYNWRTGTLVHTWPVVATARPLHQVRHVAVYGQLAVYSAYRYGSARSLHVLRLTTGKDVALAKGGGTGYYGRDAAIGPRGLVYAVNQHERGKLVFVPLAKVLRAVS
jgi:hypothetical protein